MAAQSFKNYLIEREIGKGGMATIFLAEDSRTGRKVALKFLLPHIATNEQFIGQFIDEFRANQFLKHANIVEAIEAGEDEGRWFIAMEYVDGRSLKELLRDCGRLPVDLAVHVIINMLKGLHFSHHCGVIHQDVKPANVMVQRDGAVKIADFGISRVASPALWTPTGKIRGTPAYMAPEQAGGREPNYKWDIFSAGVVFYELMAGFNPFGAPDPQVALKKIAGETPPPLLRASPAMALDVEVIVARMLEKDPDKRYANVETILKDLQRATSSLQLDYSQEVFRDWLADAEPVNAMLRASRSAFHLDVAKKLLQQGKAFSDVALWEVYRAALSDTGNQEARAMLPQVARENGYTMQASNSMAIKAAEARLAEQPDDVKLLLQVAKLYRAEGNVLQTFYFGRSALSLAPLDPGVRLAVDKVLGPGKLQYL